jgi:hypothetical protein
MKKRIRKELVDIEIYVGNRNYTWCVLTIKILSDTPIDKLDGVCLAEYKRLYPKSEIVFLGVYCVQGWGTSFILD